MPIKPGAEFLNMNQGAKTATFSSTAQTFKARRAKWYAGITAVSGTTPTLLLEFQTSIDGGTTWLTIGLLYATAVGTTTMQELSIAGEQVRLSGTIGGTTPSFTIQSMLTEV